MRLCVDDHAGHLLERGIVLCADRRPGPHVGFIPRKQGMHWAHELVSNDESTLMSVPGGFVVLAPVEHVVLHGVLSGPVSLLDGVVASVGVGDLSERLGRPRRASCETKLAVERRSQEIPKH